MRRALTIARIAAVYLLLGFVTTWAVAWGLALLPPGTDYVQGSSLPPNSDLMRTLPPLEGPHVIFDGVRGFGSARAEYLTLDTDPRVFAQDPWRDLYGEPRNQRFTNSQWFSSQHCLDLSGFDGWGMRRVALREGRDSPWAIGVDDARGFPFLAVWCSWQPPRSTMPGLQPKLLTLPPAGGIPLALGPRTASPIAHAVRALPYYPIWSGLAINTSFYALLFFILVRLTKGTRHLIRFRRGLCPRCKYDREFDYRLPCPECGDAPRAKRHQRKRGAAA